MIKVSERALCDFGPQPAFVAAGTQAALKILVKIKRVIRRVMTVKRTFFVAHEIKIANLNLR